MGVVRAWQEMLFCGERGKSRNFAITCQSTDVSSGYGQSINQFIIYGSYSIPLN